MDTMFMNSENSRTSSFHMLSLNLLDKIEVINMLLYQILAFNLHGNI